MTFLRFMAWEEGVYVMKTQQVLQQVTTRGFSVWGCKERHVCVWVRLFGGEVFRI